MKILFVDCCIRPEAQSRTHKLCRLFLDEYLRLHRSDTVETLRLADEPLQPMLLPQLQERDALLAAGKFGHEMFRYSHQFAEADRVLIGAPYWDLSFPALLKVYVERLSVSGITFEYVQGRPVGRCKADKLMLIQTAGGFLAGSDEGADYLRAIANMFGVGQFDSFCAEGLDVQELDQTEIWDGAVAQVKALAEKW